MNNLLVRRSLWSVLTLALLAQSGSAVAFGVLQAYESALQNDPVYRSAVSENEAGQQYRVLGRAGLLPSVSANYSTYKNKADITSKNQLGQSQSTHPDYNSAVGVVQARQPLFNLDALARYYQGIAQTNYSNAVFSSRSQELVLRVMSAYADTQYAEDQLMLVTAQREAFAEQMRVNDRTFQKGEGTRTDVLETQARFELAEAQVFEAKDNLTNARNTLAGVIGRDVPVLDALGDDFRVAPMQPAGFEEWSRITLERNPEIEAQRFGVEAALQEVKRNRAGHTPRVDLVASYNKNNSETINTYNQDSNVRSLGVQVVIPIYSGGSVNASTSQAVANSEKAK
ncbi:MAG: TolC family outer membrane protein, partial [Herminiimonas sp.]|nr:TolC family outer membrane protein [Herminiimonas sp.]